MKRARLFAVLGAALLFMLVGCSQQGVLTVENDTNGFLNIYIDGDWEERIDAHDDYVLEYDFPGFIMNLLKQETEEFELSFDGLTVRPGAEDIVVEAGDDEDYPVSSDCATIRVWNNSIYTITGVYFSLDDNFSDESNDLIGTIPPGGGVFFRMSQPAAWYVAVEDTAPSAWSNTVQPYIGIDSWGIWDHDNSGGSYGGAYTSSVNVPAVGFISSGDSEGSSAEFGGFITE